MKITIGENIRRLRRELSSLKKAKEGRRAELLKDADYLAVLEKA